MVQNKKLFKATWDAPPPNRLEGIKRIFKAFFFAMLLFFTLLKAALKRTAKKCPNARKGNLFTTGAY